MRDVSPFQQAHISSRRKVPRFEATLLTVIDSSGTSRKRYQGIQRGSLTQQPETREEHGCSRYLEAIRQRKVIVENHPRLMAPQAVRKALLLIQCGQLRQLGWIPLTRPGVRCQERPVR